MTDDDRQAPCFPDAGHDHDRCLAEALARAEALCIRAGARLTPLRRRVLELVWQSHEPVGAYDLLRRLSQERRRAAPPTVYRALEFLRDQGLVHRVESLSAYIGCPDPEVRHAGQFLICDACRTAVELQDRRVETAVERSASAAGFAVSDRVIELHGLCKACREAEHGA